MPYRPTDYNDPEFYDPNYDDLKRSKIRVYRCSDGMCGCEDCETCYPLMARKVVEDYEEEVENEN